jgi:peptidoglycan/xylan/chitin deacetylase (PgdA/CDA1 family)
VLLAERAAVARGVALTFDDGPDPHGSEQLLDVLAEHGAHATFFLIGERARMSPALVGRVVADGHEVGNHLWQDRPSVLAGRRAFVEDLAATQALLTELGGVPPTFVRPASGWFTPGMLRAVRRGGCRLALGSVAVTDLSLADWEAALAFVVRRLQPGSVVVLHENHAPPERLVVLVDRLLVAMGERGLAAVTLSALSPPAADGRRASSWRWAPRIPGWLSRALAARSSSSGSPVQE